MLQHISIDLHIHISLFQVEKKNSENLHRISTIILWIVICHVLFYVLTSINWFVYSSLPHRKWYMYICCLKGKLCYSNNICHVTEKNTNYLTSLLWNVEICTMILFKRQGRKISTSMMNSHQLKKMGKVLIPWTFYSATSFLEKCRKTVLEKWFFKLGFFFLVNHFSSTWKNVDL